MSDDHGDRQGSVAGMRELSIRSAELLEYPRVLEQVASYTQMPQSHEMALNLWPSYEVQIVELRQQETDEARILLDNAGEIDLSMSRDIRVILRRAELHATLSGEELNAVADAIEVVQRAKQLTVRGAALAPAIRNLGRSIPDLRPIQNTLRSKIRPSGEIHDDATPLLRELRAESSIAYKSASRELNRIIESEESRDFLQERIVTIRSERLVLPLKADFRGKIDGILHDVSDSGSTLYVEPFSSVALMNTWREIVASEKEESVRILRRLSLDVSKRISDIALGLEMTGRIDFALAKARLAKAQNCARVAISPGGNIRLSESRHPLLSGETVPISLELIGFGSGLLITGPNTGGKTVALKTLGLMVLMNQSGLQIPSGPSTELPIVDNVFADIGDQQDIDHSLSTFGSHMHRISDILTFSTANSLVLLDELGTSTDPTEGSALGQAILSELTHRAGWVVATTHHRSMAEFAETHGSLTNASVELDPVSLRPTYHIVVGVPGRSYAITVARQIGLSSSVIEVAEAFLDPVYKETELLLIEVQKERHQLSTELAKTEQALRDAEHLRNELQEKLDQISKTEDRVVLDTKRGLESTVKQILNELRQVRSEALWSQGTEQGPELGVIESSVIRIGEIGKSIRNPSWGQRKPPRVTSSELRIGDVVEIAELGFKGTVQELLPDGKADVLVGSANIRVDRVKLDICEPVDGMRRDSIGITVNLVSHSDSLGEDVDLRGMRLHEAVEKLDLFIDRALSNGMAKVRVVHGRGSGALRRGVWEHLAHHIAVQAFDFEQDSRSHGGSTIVNLG